MNSCSESKHVGTKFNVILNAIAGSPQGQSHHINMCQLLWALDVLTLGRKGNRYTRRKILVAQERSTIDTQLAHERTTSDLVSVLRGTIVRSLGSKNWQDCDKVSMGV